MRVLFDTSVLIAAMVSSHPFHQQGLTQLQKVRKGEIVGLISVHSLAEIYSVLTKLPVFPKVSPQQARDLIQKNVVELFEVVTLDKSEYVSLLDNLAQKGISGGAVYDALIIYAGIKSEVKRILTLNPKDFKRVYPEYAERMIEP